MIERHGPCERSTAARRSEGRVCSRAPPAAADRQNQGPLQPNWNWPLHRRSISLGVLQRVRLCICSDALRRSKGRARSRAPPATVHDHDSRVLDQGTWGGVGARHPEKPTIFWGLPLHIAGSSRRICSGGSVYASATRLKDAPKAEAAATTRERSAKGWYGGALGGQHHSTS